jgi:hypothetical protein
MTCEELTQLIADLADQISDKQTLIVGATAGCLSNDVWAGTVPSAPLTLASVNTRISDLQMLLSTAPANLQPYILNSIASYQAIKQMMDDKAALEMQRQMAINTKNMQGC